MEVRIMNISSIRESGSSNLLKWAIDNKADLKNNLPLTSLINDELFYLVNIEGVNFYEVFRLTQLYRNKLRVLNVNVNKVPDEADLRERFPSVDIDCVNDSINSFLSLTAQMAADSDIIEEGFPRLFIPMIASSFNIQIPFSFIDIIDVISDDDAKSLFSPDYPRTLSEVVEDGKHNLLKSAILISIEKNTRNIRYDKKYEKLLDITKYFPLKGESDQIFKFGLIGFFKFDNVARSEVRCNMFRADKVVIESKMQQMSKLKTPLELEFAIQLPIYHMNLLEASYYPEDLKISYRSPIGNIIDNGMVFHNFKYNEDESNGTAIDAYKVRISEANHTAMETIGKLVQAEDSHPQSVFSLLPPIYLTNAVITVSYESIPQLLSTSDNVLYALFKNIENIANVIHKDIHSN